MFQVSIVTAVYNHSSYVRQAVESALAQPETGEVLLIEDGSTDDSFTICQLLAHEYSKVRLYQHPDKKNHGYPATLNLGITLSQYEYIAFLDADDFYLPGRFAVTKRIFQSDPTADGVYEAIGIYFDSLEGKERWVAAGRSLDDLTTISKALPPEQLLDAYVWGGFGDFSKDGLTVKRNVFELTGFYDEHLLLHQDTAMNLKMAAVCRLLPGQLEQAVAMRRVHTSNRISAPRSSFDRYYTNLITYRTVWRWGRANVDNEKEKKLLQVYLKAGIALPRSNRSLLTQYILCFLLLLKLPFYDPCLIRKKEYWLRMIPSRIRAEK